MKDSLEALLWENRRLFRALATAADQALQPLGIQAGSRALLEFLAREPDPISLSELARKRNVSRQHIHTLLRDLPDPEWVERLPDPHDSRAVLLRLSRKGRAFWKRVRVVDHDVLKKLARRLNEREVQAAARTLRRIRELLSEESS